MKNGQVALCKWAETGPTTWAGGPSQWTQGRALGQRRRWRRPDRVRLAGSGVGREVVLGRLDSVAHPSGESGQGGPHRKNELHGNVWSARGERWWGAASGGGGRQLAVRGGRTQWCGARGAVKSIEERLEWAVHGGSVAVGVERGGAAVRGRRGCRARSWKGHRGAPTWGGARGGDDRAGWWPEEATLGGPGCGSRRWNSDRRKQRWGVNGRRRSKRGSSSAGHSPYSRMTRWPRAVEPVGGKYGGR
jgi:hypothetical protein